jgi:hypothetical protein
VGRKFVQFGKKIRMVFGKIPFDLFVIHDTREVLDRDTQGEGVVSVVIPDSTKVLLQGTHRMLHVLRVEVTPLFLTVVALRLIRGVVCDLPTVDTLSADVAGSLSYCRRLGRGDSGKP